MIPNNSLLTRARAAGTALLDFLYPRRCMGCQRWMPRGEPGFLCAECYQAIAFINNPCKRCGAPLGPYSQNDKNCPKCRQLSLHFHSARAAGTYSSPLKELVHSLKYSRELAAVTPLAEIILDALRSSPIAEFSQVVVPVPLHPSRLRHRTFNQSALIGRAVARHLDIPFSDALARTRPTESQTNLLPAARRRNIKGAFGIRRKEAVAGRQVLLIDDVITTGATASECAKVLKGAGAARVCAAAVAR